MADMKRRFMKNNKGYSLVEMIICIAIIAVLSSVAFVTVSMINSAKAKDAAVNFNSVVSETISKAKGQMCVVNGVEEPTYKRCLHLYLDDSSGRYYLKIGYYNPDGLTDADKYIFVDSENKNEGKGNNLTAKVSIQYKDLDGNKSTIDSDGVYIIFNKNGTCYEGAGLFEFYKRNGNLVDEVSIKTNGSHQLY